MANADLAQRWSVGLLQRGRPDPAPGLGRASPTSSTGCRTLDDIDLTLALPTGEAKPIGGGSRPLTATGRAGELTLFLAGRREAAQVELKGETEAVDEVRTGKLGI